MPCSIVAVKTRGTVRNFDRRFKSVFDNLRIKMNDVWIVDDVVEVRRCSQSVDNGVNSEIRWKTCLN